MNTVILTGRLTKDPELKTSTNGKHYTFFYLAVPRSYQKDATDFIDCRAWDKTAETLYKYTKKGAKILVIGEYRVDKGQDDTYKHYILVNRIELLGFNNADEINTSSNVRQLPQQSNQNNGFTSYQEEEFPF